MKGVLKITMLLCRMKDVPTIVCVPLQRLIFHINGMEQLKGDMNTQYYKIKGKEIPRPNILILIVNARIHNF